MQCKFQKSETLRQSKICVAVATVLAAMSLPAQAEFFQGEVATWTDQKANIVNRMKGRLDQVRTDYAESAKKADRLDALKKVRSSVYSEIKGIVDKAEYDNKLTNSVDTIDDVIAKLNEEDGIKLAHRWERDLTVADLEDVKREIQKVLNANLDDVANAREQLTDFLSDDAAVLKSRNDATDLYAKLTEIDTRIKALDKAGEAAFKVMANTKELVVPAQNGTDAVLTWRDDNLFNSHFDEGYVAGGVEIGKETVLDITKRSGAASDAVSGAPDGVRDVGAIRLAEDVSHLVGVVDGALNVHQGIEGDGELAVAVGTKGTLNFVANGKGIDAAAKRVVLMAGRGASAAEVLDGTLTAEAVAVEAGAANEGGAIVFNTGTSAQNAAIAISDGGHLRFEEGASAGASTIMVTGGSAHFEKASAGSASIQNAGMLEANRTSMNESSVINHATGEFTLTGSRLEGMRLTNLGDVDVEESLGGNALISNDGEGHLTIVDSKLEHLTLINASEAMIDGSSGGNATIRNDEGAVLKFVDTKLEALQLENRGEVVAAGSTTADNARIRLEGGAFDVSNVGEWSESGPREGDITIGSLSGRGDLIAGDTRVTLGALNLDDVFEGRILNELKLPLDAGQSSRSKSALYTEAPISPADVDGVRLTKVGTGNLTLAGDQSGVTSLSVQGGTLTAAHANALGSGTVNVAGASTVALSADVSGVQHLQNEGTVDLGMSKLEVGTYASEAGATIKSRVAKEEGKLVGGKIHVTKSADFGNTKLDVAAASDIDIQDIVGNFEVVNAEENAAVTGGELTVGSITGG
ncbi:hypothetical protein, partial [Pandoraea bronchicola]|uniref:hypothetical protein n=1 Tax=Pandoraea bronchicola TaxID=2508287 RepID=UPI001240DA6E